MSSDTHTLLGEIMTMWFEFIFTLAAASYLWMMNDDYCDFFSVVCEVKEIKKKWELANWLSKK